MYGCISDQDIIRYMQVELYMYHSTQLFDIVLAFLAA